MKASESSTLLLLWTELCSSVQTRGVSSSSSSRHAQKILQLAPVFWHEAARDENLEPQLPMWDDRRLTILFKPSMAVRVYFPLVYFPL